MKVIKKAGFLVILGLFLTQGAFAQETPQIVTGAVNLFSDLFTWLLILIPVLAGAMVAWHMVGKMTLDDPAQIADKNDKVKKIIISGIIGFSAVGLVNLVFSYFK